MSVLRYAAWLLPVLLLAGCESGGRRDGAPLVALPPESIPDAVPRPDPVTDLGNKSPYVVNGVTYEVMADPSGYREIGIASWYGTKFHGRRTSNGERFDLYRATAAHRSLPIPCYVTVTNLENGRSIVVRANDRGPFHSERLIDLSYGAAVKLGSVDHGTARVAVELLEVAGVDDRRADGVAPGVYRYLQMGAFAARDTADEMRRELARLVRAPVTVSPVQAGGDLLYRVRIGPLENSAAVRALQQQLAGYGFGRGHPLP